MWALFLCEWEEARGSGLAEGLCLDAVVRVSQSLGECVLTGQVWATVLAMARFLSSSPVAQGSCTSHLPPFWVGLGGVCICDREDIDGISYGKGHRGPGDLAKGLFLP